MDTGYTGSISRWWNQSGRKQTLEFLTTFYQKIYDIINCLIDIYKINDDLKSVKSKECLLMISSNLRNSRKGLYNLKNTYENDMITCFSLNDIIKNISHNFLMLQSYF